MALANLISEVFGVGEPAARIIVVISVLVFVGMSIWAVCDALGKAGTEFCKAMGEYNKMLDDIGKDKSKDKK
jgi:hypothetical protein